MATEKNKKRKIPQIKQDIKDFLSKEEGNMIKKDVVKMGLGLLALSIGLKSGMSANEANAQGAIPGTCERCSGDPIAPGCHPWY